MSGQNVLVSGTPRSGTTLTCHLLNKLPNTVALHEPMSVKKFAAFASHDEINTEIDRFCAAQRHSIHTRGVAISKQSGGQVPDNPIERTQSSERLRRSVVSRGEITIEKPLAPDFTLVIKHNAAFAAAIATLVKRFPVYAIIRNPLATLASWSTVAIPVQMGGAPAAERIDPKLQAGLATIQDELDRQIFLLDWYHAQYHTHLPADSIIAYETIVASGGKALRVVRPEAASLDEPLTSQNASKLYDYPRMLRIGERLLRSDGAHWTSYTKASVEQLLNELATDVA
jgi:hypothetical protein